MSFERYLEKPAPKPAKSGRLVRLPEGLAEWTVKTAQEYGVSQAKLVEAILLDAMIEHKPGQEIERVGGVK